MPENVRFLTIENVLADYVEIIKQVKNEHNIQNNPVFAFGGSYGGELSAWLRMKHPDIVNGALSSSAPLFYRMNLQQIVPNNTYEL